MITCNEALELLSVQLDGAITIEEQTALQEHLAACPECRRIQSELKMAEEALPELQQGAAESSCMMRSCRRSAARRDGKRSERRFCALSVRWPRLRRCLPYWRGSSL